MEKQLMVQRSTLWRGAIAGIWLVLFIMLLQRDIFITAVTPVEQEVVEQAEREEYQGIYFREQKIGYVVNHYQPHPDGSQEIDQKAHMNLRVGDAVHQIDLHLQAGLNSNSVLEQFSLSFISPFYQMRAEGEAVDNRITFTLNTGNNVVTDTMVLDGPPMVPTARRAYLLQQQMDKGEKIKVPWFDPVSLTAKNSIVEYRGKERVLIGGRVHNLHRFTENFGGAWINIWLNDDGDVMKEQSPAGFVFIKEPKFRALDLGDEPPADDLLAAVAVRIEGDMPDLAGRDIMQYRLEFPDDGGFDLNSGRQEYRNSILTIHKETLPAKVGAAVGCANIDDSLEASPYIQADNVQIEELAAQLVTATGTDLETIRTLAQWVYEHLEKRPVLGIPDALTTLKNRRGDCNEHAALFAALARNRGIPTRIAAGVVYHKGAFYYHAWNEVCVGGIWLSVDTTTNQFPADLSHIKFVQGELNEQVRIGALLGKLRIEPLSESEHTALQ